LLKEPAAISLCISSTFGFVSIVLSRTGNRRATTAVAGRSLWRQGTFEQFQDEGKTGQLKDYDILLIMAWSRPRH